MLAETLQISVMNNHFHGSIDSCFYKMPIMYFFQLSQNNFNGSLKINHCNNHLAILNFGYNKFSGTIPSQIFNVSCWPVLVLYGLLEHQFHLLRNNGTSLQCV